MKASERATQLWAVLALAARHRQTLTYDLAAQLIGVARQGIGQLLEPIQSYCLLNDLPALTSLVVAKDTGLPSHGFTAADASKVPAAQARVFDHDWLAHGCPTPDQFEDAVRKHPSRGSTES
jgi:hypothetical protein